ncbi:MAG: crossover junction endodeoxyribonuclease RuvC [candidate division WOR-3 bacterium]
MRTSTSRTTSSSACPGPERSPRVLGIDPGLSASGFGIVEGRTAVGFGVIATRAGRPLAERLRELADGLDRVVRRYRPDSCAMETMFFKGGGARSVILAAEARGALLAVLGRREVSVTEFTPATVKLSVTGSGRASKFQLNYMIRQILKLDGRVPEHAADALAAAWCLAQRSRRR